VLQELRMRKHNAKKLSLDTSTLRNLDQKKLANAAGGAQSWDWLCPGPTPGGGGHVKD
jgi:hypothetical protein